MKLVGPGCAASPFAVRAAVLTLAVTKSRQQRDQGANDEHASCQPERSGLSLPNSQVGTSNAYTQL